MTFGTIQCEVALAESAAELAHDRPVATLGPSLSVMVDPNAACYRHPDRPHSVGCQRCDRPICASCMTAASVGFHCPECSKSGAQKVIRPGQVSRPIFTQVILGLIGAAFLSQGVSSGGNGFLGGPVYTEGVLFGPLVANGEIWRIVTSGFLHSSLLHVGFNAYAMWIFGQAVERTLGWQRTALVYFGGLFGGAAAVLAFDFAIPTLGASGAVLGLAGGLAALMQAQGQNIFRSQLGTIFLINLGLPLIPGFNISFWGHFGGIVGGFLVASAIAAGAKARRSGEPDRSVLMGAGVVTALAVASLVAGVVLKGIA